MENNVDNASVTRGDQNLRVTSSNQTPANLNPDNKRLKLSFRQIRAESGFRRLLVAMGIIVLLLVAGILVTLVVESIPTISKFGIGYLWGKTWDPVRDVFGAYPYLLGTLYTSFLALIISVPFSFAVAVFLGEYFPKGAFSEFLKNTVDLIAAVPSVIYGFWAIAVLVPLIHSLEVSLEPTFTRMGITIDQSGVGIFTSSIVLATMIVPYAAALGREMIRMVPSPLKEGAYSLGATRWEVVRSIILPYTKSGLFAGVLLSLGRALGETMAVTMVIGNVNSIPKSIFSPGNTLASVIANEYSEAGSSLHLSALTELGLVLFLVTVAINMIGKRIISRYSNS